MRFGNKAFRTWYDKALKTIEKDIGALYSTHVGFARAVPELKVYFESSFGNYDRLDYGAGNELNFIIFLMCLYKIGVLVEADL